MQDTADGDNISILHQWCYTYTGVHLNVCMKNE